MNKATMSQSKARDKKKRTIYDVHYLWYLFTHNKRWFALSLILCICCAVAFVYFVYPAYSVTGKMLITEKKNNTAATNASLLLQSQLPMNLSSSLGGSIGVENEKEILRSRLLACKIVKRLKLNTEYRNYYGLKGRLLYKNQPINVLIDQDLQDIMDNSLPMTKYQIDLSIYKTPEGYRVKGKLKENKKKIEIPEQSFKSLPATIQTGIGRLGLAENKTLTPKQAKRYQDDYRLDVRILPTLTAANRLSKRLTITTAAKKATNTINLKMKDESILRGIDYINALAEEYNSYSTEEKHKEVSKYDDYVRKRLKNLDAELGLTDENWANYKQQNKVTEPKVDAEEVITKKSEYEAQVVGLDIQLQLFHYLKEYVDDPSNIYEIIPVNLGIFAQSTIASSFTDPVAAAVTTGDAVNVIGRHNALVDQRNQLLKSTTEKSPQVQQVTGFIDELHPVIQKSLERDIRSLELRRNGLEREYNKYMSRVSSAPEQERVLTDIGRQRKVQEGVFVSLLQKREENAMDMMNSVDKGRLIDVTQYSKKAMPIIWLVALITLFVSFVIPFACLFLIRYFKSKITNYDDIDDLARFPILGMVSSEEGKDSISFSMIRNSLLHYMTDGQKIVMITSYGEGEGKTAVSMGLANALCSMGKKVIVCDLNLYHPSLGKAQGTGWGGLVLNDRVSQESVMSAILHADYRNGVDVLVAGDINDATPANLIAHDHLKSILTMLRNVYDYIILDTPAIGQHGEVLIDDLADVTCIVCRSHKTKKTEVEYMNQLGETERLSCPLFVYQDDGAK